MIRTLFSTLSVLLALGASAASAAPASEPVSVRIRIADLDLNAQAGAQVALQRIRTAAQAACGGETDARRLDRVTLFGACVKSTVDRAVTASHSPVLATLNGAATRPTQIAAR